ncbi:S-type pyocin domain-containing protein, partial [Photobacterium sp. 1_MG-2023]|uniref:S-type pyocin domain-containing protein n=1 Tax=Photobacterium sp. 1_MG-2023 TaxID=3062646 RepID=UPI0026E3D6D9
MPHKVWHHDDTQYTEEELRNLESVQSRMRISLTDPAPGEQYPTVHAWQMNFARIPVFQVGFDEDNQSFSVALGKEGPEMTWLPTATG